MSTAPQTSAIRFSFVFFMALGVFVVVTQGWTERRSAWGATGGFNFIAPTLRMTSQGSFVTLPAGGAGGYRRYD